MQTDFLPLDKQHGKIQIQLTKQDLDPMVKSELKKIKNKAQIKGFRQGGVPESLLMNLYGTEIKADAIQKLVQQSVESYLKENNKQLVGEIMAVNDPIGQLGMSADAYQFEFELGFAPDPDISTALEGTNLVRYKIQIPESKIEEEISFLLTKYGNLEDSTEAVKVGDQVKLEVHELENGVVKPEGVISDFVVLVDDTLTDEFQQTLLGKITDDEFTADIYQIEKKLDLNQIKKYFLKLEENDEREFGNLFQVKIIQIQTNKASTENEEFYKKVFGNETEVVDSLSFRQQLRTSLQVYYDLESEKMLDFMLVKELAKTSQMEFPDNFLKKWLQSTSESWAKKSGYELEHDFFHFKESLAWRILREKYSQIHEIQISRQELENYVIHSIKQKYGEFKLDEEVWRGYVRKMLEDKEQAMNYYVELENLKVIEHMKASKTIDSEDIELENFNTKVQEINSHHHTELEHHHEH
ncbi:MAG: hypothetical protein K1X49_12830 [Saprospiraceae bacterium]|nr:hypothetical protein [Saprospiraceae bacterium]